MNHINTYFYKIATVQLVAIMSVVYLLFPFYLLPTFLDTGETGPLDLLFWYNHDTFYFMVTSYGQTIRNNYIWGLLTVDVAYPIFYGTLLAIMIALLQKKLPLQGPNRLILIPYIAVIFDLLENVLLSFLISHYPTKYVTVASAVGYTTASKWIAVFITIITVSTLFTIGLYKKVTLHKS